MMPLALLQKTKNSSNNIFWIQNEAKKILVNNSIWALGLDFIHG